MAIEDRVSGGIGWTNLTEFKQYGEHLLRGVMLAIVVIAWVTFWGVVVRLHVQQGDIISAVVVSALFVLPAIVGYAWYLRGKLRNT